MGQPVQNDADKSPLDLFEEESKRPVEEPVESRTPAHLEFGGRDYRVEGNNTDAYIGVSPEYMTYANEAHKPLATDYELLEFTDVYDHLIDNGDDDGNPIEDTEVDEEKTPVVSETDDQSGAVVDEPKADEVEVAKPESDDLPLNV